MKIGFYLMWDKTDMSDPNANVVGDEFVALSLIKGLKIADSNVEAEVYAPNYLPTKKLDVMIYMNSSAPNLNFADKHVLYLQNSYMNIEEIKPILENKYDAYLSFSSDLIDRFKDSWGEDVLYLPFSANSDIYYPAEYEEDYDYDVTYVGSDIKGEECTRKYIMPAINHGLALFGNWHSPLENINKKSIIKNLLRLSISKVFKDIKTLLTTDKNDYRVTMASITKGKIPQEKIATLYSSSKIVLNCTGPGAVRDNTITLRTYEVLGCKGFLISDRTPLAEQLLKDCVVFTDGGKDLEDKIEYYLKHPEERQRIAENGYNWVMANATSEILGKKLYDYLNAKICI